MLISYEGHQTLYEFLRSDRTDKELMDVAIDICVKVREIHQKGIIHNDLKLDNLMVDEGRKVHVIDFNNAVENGKPFCYTGQPHALPWLAPELFHIIPVSPV